MNTKHTPGPWHRNIRANGKYPVVFSGRNRHVASVCRQDSGEEMEANIDLIAAAPDLLESLESTLAIVQNYYDTLPDDGIEQDCIATAIIEPARAAIAKATGNNP